MRDSFPRQIEVEGCETRDHQAAMASLEPDRVRLQQPEPNML
jgi:hypothetical protein